MNAVRCCASKNILFVVCRSSGANFYHEIFKITRLNPGVSTFTKLDLNYRCTALAQRSLDQIHKIIQSTIKL